MRWKTARTLPTIRVKDEYEHYCNEDPTIVSEKEIFSPIDWWRSTVNQRLYPRLSRDWLTTCYLCPQCLPSASLQLYSILLSDLRSTMDMASIEASECVRDWLRTVFADAQISTPRTSFTDPWTTNESEAWQGWLQPQCPPNRE